MSGRTPFRFIYLRGFTAHEFQLWRFGFRWVHLSNYPHRRWSFQWFGKEFDLW